MDTFAPKVGTILVIDQERAIADMLIEVLTEAGYLAYTVHDSADALAVIVTVPPALIMLDIGKHMRPGVALIDHVRAAGFGSIPIVVMSADPVAAVPVRLAPSVVECLAKPFEMDDLLVCVARYAEPQTMQLAAHIARAQQ